MCTTRSRRSEGGLEAELCTSMEILDRHIPCLQCVLGPNLRTVIDVKKEHESEAQSQCDAYAYC